MQRSLRWFLTGSLGVAVIVCPAFAQQPTGETEERLAELEAQVEELSDMTDAFRVGSTKFLATGYARSNFTSVEKGDSSFDAAFFPIFLWQLDDRLLFAAELEYELGQSSGSTTGSSDDTEVNLEFLDLSYVVNDYLTLRAGKFLTPLSTFKEQLHASWINKLPDQPLFASGGARLIPTSSLGFEARGAVPIGDRKLTYSAWVSNGPKLVTTGGKTGQLNFSNFSDVNDGKAIGGRLGFYVMPELEIAYAFNYADVGAGGTAFDDTNATIHVFSSSYVRESEALKGRIDARVEVVISEVDSTDFGSGSFSNDRNGGYAQVAYRPSLVEGWFSDLEGVVRYDWIDNPNDATSGKAYDEDRLTVGLNYWLAPSAVIKVAYRLDNVDDPTGSKSDADALLMQVSYGF